ncbi:hypothetical protein B0H10DRAFT_1955766 [Mycena sp. CBHHK59/15]|nr:hypothetical protein B0H10DRAFT_1955766 [Mycena sp. CBHHK59/15]
MGDTADICKILAGLNDHFRHPLNAANDFMAAFERAIAFSAILGGDRVSNLWQRTLKIGFRAGRGAMETAPSARSSTTTPSGMAGKAQGLKEGEIVGFERGLSKGKHLGFVVGREFGEKQTAKLSKPLASKHILVDTGTDSPLTELLLPLAPLTVTYASASVLTDAQCDTILPILSTPPSLIWADEPSDVHIPKQTNSPRLPPRDLSALRSDLTSSAPFVTLRYCAHHTQKSPRGTHHSATCPRATRGSMSKPSTANTGSSLNWDRDPRLFDLSRALCYLG